MSQDQSPEPAGIPEQPPAAISDPAGPTLTLPPPPVPEAAITAPSNTATPGAAAPQTAVGTTTRTVWGLWLTVPRDVWQGRTVDAITRVQHAVAQLGSRVGLVAFAGVGAFAGLAAFFTALYVPGDSAGLAFEALFAVLAIVVVIYLVRSLTVWWALRTRRTDATFRDGVAIVAVPACLHVFALAAAALLSLAPGTAGRVMQTVIVLPLALVVAMVTEPLIYIASARTSGAGKSILMPHTWFLVIFGVLLTLVMLVVAALGVAALIDQISGSLSDLSRSFEYGGGW